MDKKHLILVVAGGVVLLGLVMAFREQHQEKISISSPYRVIMYTVPKQPRVGEVQVAFRVHLQNYKLVSDYELGATYQHESSPSLPINLKPGPGKDFRAWLSFSQAGQYYFDVTIKDSQSTEKQVRFKLDVLP